MYRQKRTNCRLGQQGKLARQTSKMMENVFAQNHLLEVFPSDSCLVALLTNLYVMVLHIAQLNLINTQWWIKDFPQGGGGGVDLFGGGGR